MPSDKEVLSILKNQNYLSPARYISGRIIEYDIKSANISCLRQGDHITEEDYRYLASLPKKEREIEIGLRIKNDPKVYTNIQKGITNAKQLLGEYNNITEDQIVRIANDAVYINSGYDLANLAFGNYVRFVPKSMYHIYLNINKIIVLLAFKEDGNIDIDVKGINEELLPLHENFMINTIVSCILMVERSSVQEAVRYLSEICEHYVRLELPVGYYREFNAYSSYRIKNFYGANSSLFGGSDLATMQVNESDKGCLDINYNYTILRELWSILLELYSLRVN